VNIVPLNIKPLRCLETSSINRPVTSHHIPRERRTPQEITDLRVCRMSFCCVLMCKLPCCCVLVCKVSCSYFAHSLLPLCMLYGFFVSVTFIFYLYVYVHVFVGFVYTLCILCVYFHIFVFIYLLLFLVCAYICSLFYFLTQGR
jgi:hypothetical protein